MVDFRACACVALLWACGDTVRHSGVVDSGGPGGISNSGGATNSGGAEPDAKGYAIVGDDLYPPLLERVLAVDCQSGTSGAECISGLMVTELGEARQSLRRHMA